MPEYLAPGVYVEETSFRPSSIEGVSTSTTGFAGPTSKGPFGIVPELLTSFSDFQQIYGGLDDLTFGSTTVRNYVAHAVRAYFEEGGSLLYVARAFQPSNPTATPPDIGLAHVAVTDSHTPARVSFISLTPGATGNGTITVGLVATAAGPTSLARAAAGSTVRITTPGAGGAAPTITFSVLGADGATWTPALPATPAAGTQFHLITLTVSTLEATATIPIVYSGLGLSAAHPLYIGTVLSPTPTSRADLLLRLFAITIAAGTAPADLLGLLLPAALTTPPPAPPATAAAISNTFTLTGGDDGVEPSISAYDLDAEPNPKGALTLLAGVEDIAIIAAPGSSSFSDTNAEAVQHALINYAERPRAYRVAVLDTPPAQLVSEARTTRSLIDSEYAALYYPWIVVANPVPGGAPELTLPPSGFLCGIYARTDDARGVFKAPANEVVSTALRFERDVNYAEQEVLNPLGVNCLRFFPGRGYRVWGARTVSSDPDWKYISVRRYFVYLEHSIDAGTQWAVFEPNGEKLWANVRDTISAFLYGEWKGGALLGSDPTQAFFVRCDRTTMTQNDLDNGRLVCEVGVAVVKPAEFVIFRIGQMTADSRS